MQYLIEYKINPILKTIAALLLLSLTSIQSAHAIPGDILFEDDFETGTLVGKWTVDNSGGGDADVSANNNVSGSRSLYTRWEEVEVTSNAFNAAVPGAVVNIYVRRGTDALDPDSEYPEDDEHLVIQYFDGTTYQNLDTFLGDGAGSSPQGEIFNRSYQLPSDALHAALRLRIRQTDGDGGAPANGGVGWDYWHIDDVEVIETALADPLVSSYSLDDSSFATVTDTSGSGFNGAAVGNATPTTVNPVVAGSPGTCGYAEIARNTSDNDIDAINTGVDVNSIGNRGTISFWYKSNEDWDGGEDRMLIDASTDIGSGGNRKYFFLVLRDNSQLRFGLEDTNDGDYILNTGDNDTINQDEWVHIAITWDMPGDSLQIFVNGNLAANSTPNTNGALADTLGSIFLGDNSSTYQASGSSGRSANGSIDEVYFYSDVRSATQIQANRDFTRPCAPVPVTCGPIPNDYPVFSTGDDLDIDEDNPPVQIVTENGTFNIQQGDDNGNAVDVTPGNDGDVINGAYPSPLPTIEPPTFPATGTLNITVNNDLPGVDLTIDVNDNPPNNASYNSIFVQQNASVDFTGGGPFYIDRLVAMSNANINFNAGTYFIDSLDIIGSNVDITVNGPVRLFIGTQFNSNGNGDNLTVNAVNGNVSDLVVFLYPNAEFDMDGEELNFTGVIYGPQSGDIKINDDSTITGAIIGGDEVELDEGVTIIYTDAVKDAVDDITTCELTFGNFTITNDTFGLNCATENITINAIDNNGMPYDADGVVLTIDTTTMAGDWSVTTGTPANLNNGTADDGVATYTFAPGETSVVLGLNYLQGTNTFTITASAIVNGTPFTALGTPITFTPSTFIISAAAPPDPLVAAPSFPSQIAGTNVTTHITAYGAQPTVAGCGVISGYAGNKNLAMWTDYQNPMAPIATTAMTITDVSNIALPIGDTEPNATARVVNFAAGRATVIAKYKDVGLIRLSAKDTNTDLVILPDGITGSADIIFRPADILIDAVTLADGSGNFLNVTGDITAPKFLGAGNPFGIRVRAVDADGDVTPNYGRENEPMGLGPEGVSISSSTLIAPSPMGTPAGVNGTIGNPTSFSATTDIDGTPLAGGFLAGSNFTFSEVGIIKLTAVVGDGDYLGSGLGAASSTESENVGRFVPDRFNVTVDPLTLADSCGAFSYMDQNINFMTNPTITLTAVQENGATTQNYDIGPFWRYTVNLANRSYNNNAMTPATLDAPIDPMNIPTVSGNNDANGIGQLTITNEPILYQRPADPRDAAGMPPDPAIPFTADIDLDFTMADLTDTDGVCYDENNDDMCKPYSIANITGTQVRFGRLKIDSAFGSELVNLQLAVTAQYYDGLINDFVTATDDTCTALTDTPAGPPTWGHFDLPIASYTGNLSSGDTTPTLSAFVSGQADLTLSAPGGGNDGSVIVSPLLNSTIPLVQPWLQFDWDGDGNHDNDPTATATFGIYHGNDSTIYLRELY